MERIGFPLSFRIVAIGVAREAMSGRVARTAPGVVLALAEELMNDQPAVIEAARLFGEMVDAGEVVGAGRMLADFMEGKVGIAPLEARGFHRARGLVHV